MTNLDFGKDPEQKTKRLTVSNVLHDENSRLRVEVDELRNDLHFMRKENKSLFKRYTQVKSHVLISKYGDFLLTAGAIGFGVLGNCNHETFAKIGHIDLYSVLLGVAFCSAIAGLFLKYAWRILKSIIPKR